jgi:four helix bundle protein
MGKKGFRELVVWQKAKDLAVRIHQLSANGALGRDFGLCDQLRRSAVSIAGNVAEGDERDTDKEATRFFFIAKGSLAELRTQLQIAYESGYLKKTLYEDLEANCESIGKMLGSLIKARQASRAT